MAGGISWNRISMRPYQSPAKDRWWSTCAPPASTPSIGTFASAYLKEHVPLTLPATSGGDFSGIVTDVGTSNSILKVGDAVYGYASLVSGGSGSCAESAAAIHSTVARMPLKADVHEAAALPLAGASALQALEEYLKLQLKLQPGQKVLIHGAEAGVALLVLGVVSSLSLSVGGLRSEETVGNQIYVIAPYRQTSTWVFDDPTVGLKAEPFVSGIPEMIDTLVQSFLMPSKVFGFCFQPLPSPATRRNWCKCGPNTEACGIDGRRPTWKGGFAPHYSNISRTHRQRYTPGLNLSRALFIDSALGGEVMP